MVLSYRFCLEIEFNYLRTKILNKNHIFDQDKKKSNLNKKLLQKLNNL